MKGGKTVIVNNTTNILEKQHNVILENRKKLVLSGVFEVESFEDDNVQLKTAKGELNIRGEGLKMENFVLETGDLSISGNVYALIYLNDSLKKQSFFSRLFK